MKYCIGFELPSGIFIEEKECTWFWCSFCKTVSLRFPCCDNTTCNCGGCDKCIPTSEKVGQSIKIPEKNDLKEVKYYLTEDDAKHQKLLEHIFDVSCEIYDE
jgi:hypothetical protein